MRIPFEWVSVLANCDDGVFCFICSARTTPVSVFARFALFLVDLREGCPCSDCASRAYVAFFAACPRGSCGGASVGARGGTEPVR